MPSDVVSKCLGIMTRERLDCVADDGHFPCRDGDVGAHPGFQLPDRRIELRPRRSRLLERFGLIGGRQTRTTRELFGSLSQRKCLSPRDVIAGAIMFTGGEDSHSHISKVIARDPGDGAVTSRSADDAFTREPTRSSIKVEAWAQERIASPGCPDPLFGEG